MNCMKCGVEIPEKQVFCERCLAAMEAYPVKPDAHIHLPKREDAAEIAKRSAKKKRAPNAEEKISALRMKLLRLRLVTVILLFLLCIVSAFLGLKVYEDYTSKPATGKNYTIDTSTKAQPTTQTGVINATTAK